MESPGVRKISSAAPDKHSDNKIRNTKYTTITFLPLVLIQQFHSFSSVYFFFIMSAQGLPKLAVSSIKYSLFPWLFVVTLSLINEGLDDYKRHQRDKESNSGLYKVWKRGTYESVTSAKIKTGDIILVNKGDRVPADCILLKVDDASGEIFIRTDQLDGETDWKRRIVHTETQRCCIEALDNLDATAELPHKGIYSFTGSLEMDNLPPGLDNSQVFIKEPGSGSSVAMNEESYGTPSVASESVVTEMKIEGTSERVSLSIDLENALWANTVLATSSALCLVVYTGDDTRSMMNTYKPRSKLGKIEKELDYFIFILGISSAIVSLLFTLIRATSLSFGTLIIFFRFLILFSYVIPISLKVTINLARIWYLRMVQSAKHLEGVIVRSSSLQEELGRVSFFLTDKTGTLTKNEMVMKKVHLGTICYNAENTKEVNSLLKAAISGSEDESEDDGKIFKKSKGLNTRVYELAEALALCHGVTPVDTEAGVAYQASSPDEIAIIKYTEQIGMRLVRRDRVRIVINTPTGDVSYKILQTFPFNSDSKRMGIIVQKEAAEGSKGTNDNEILFFEKGADTAMKPIIKESDWIEEETDNMARDGLRTLLIGKKVLKKDEYRSFSKSYERARLSLVERNEKMFREQCKIETGLDLLGLTGVEDKLQDRVKPTLENLRNAGMRIWMLTGDKIETAISIALSSRLLDKSDKYMIVAGCETREEMAQHLRNLTDGNYNALVIDGISLTVVIDSMLHEFVAAAKDLNCVVGCRYSPTQKATMAAALRNIACETVCCIGDGGNDVSMITEADIGVGIEGKEGNQASLAADFSIRNFADVADLFFWHGRRCYKNTASLAGIIIHRGTMISVVQGIFCALIYFVPISIFQGRMLMFFIAFTFPPLFAFIYSEDVPYKTVMKFPELYKELRTSRLLSVKNLLGNNLNSLFQGSVIMLFLFFKLRELFSLSILVFTCLILNEQVTICLTIEHLSKEVLGVCTLSLCMYIVAFFIFDEFKAADFIPNYLSYIFGASFSAMSLRIIFKIYSKWINPASYVKLRH
ncbi:phospholipid-translocating ATPase [Pancytospora epiphaga]|nr:phospholipid-translocating ATPase [Pancytospora epiphaga]